MLRIYTHSLLLHCENNRYANLYHKINTVINKELQKKIIINFFTKKLIYINKTHLEYNKEIIDVDKIYQANYQSNLEHNYQY